MSLDLIVYGIPAPQGSKRHVGHGVMIESSAKVKPWREAVKWAVVAEREAWGAKAPMEGPLHIRVIFTLPRPATAPRRVVLPAKRPDLDKLLRSTFDALGEAGVWKDDAQVVSVDASKVFPGNEFYALGSPGARIKVSEVAG